MATPAPPMASPAKFEVTRILGAGVHNSQFKFSNLYLRQIFSGPDTNQSGIIVANTATGLGETAVNNWGIYDGLGSNATLVARAQGVHTFAANWQNWLTLVFEDQRFKGSTLSITGASFMEPDEWAIVGGTGNFAMASGVIERKFYQDGAGERIHEITIDGYCRMNLQTVPTPTKSGPWGAGKANVLYDMTEKSQRLVSLTIRFFNEIESITFSYLNESGKLRTAGLWGRHIAGLGRVEKTITFGPSEVVTGITGIAAYDGKPDYLATVAQFKIVTNFTTYGPFGTHTVGPLFSFVVPADKTVVGFFVNTGSTQTDYIRNIGVYTI